MSLVLPIAFLVLVAGFIGFAVYVVRKGMRHSAELAAKQEALFASMFPDLQPYYHPKKVLEFVRERLAQARDLVAARCGRP